ncbi:AraC family transcriptional regulator [Actinoplanes sp. M2I2]|uniref:AraC family transcriptional regulator n=1 Tax=Actinoplanes sp. M2I2 TaxID=1734444 RepID=UPI00201FC63D|nr:AraC family transcriptional regulator [Actinoplanes sp. M2I2]
MTAGTRRTRSAFADLDLRFGAENPDGAGLRSAATRLGDTGVLRLHYSGRTQLRTTPSGDVYISHLTAGEITLASGKDEYRAGAGEVLLVLPDDSQDVDWQVMGAFAVRLPRALLEEAAQARTGLDGGDLRFTGSRPLSPELGRHWTQTINYLGAGVLADPALAANPLIAGNAQHLLAATALAVFPTSLPGAPRSAGTATSQVVRRAMAYIDDNADRAVTITEMAAAAGVQPRALQLAFRRHRDTTPTRYARTVRLERAHRDLRAADPTTGITIATIATRWGFTHLGRFSTDYRAAYGVSPSHTLRT